MGSGAANAFEIVVDCFIHSTPCHHDQRNTTKQGEHNQGGFWTTHSCDLSVNKRNNLRQVHAVSDSAAASLLGHDFDGG